MLSLSKVKFEFPLHLSGENKEMFILEGFAVANDFDLQNDIISDKALRMAVKDFKKNGEFRLRHTEEVIGKILDAKFTKGKIWIKTIVTDSSTIEKVKSGELNCLSVGGQVNGRKVERIFAPDLRILINIIDNAHLEEVSLVPQGAQPQAKAIRWYIKNAIDMAEKIMNKKNLDEDLKNLKETEEDAIVDEEDDTEKDTETVDNSENESSDKEKKEKNLSEDEEKKDEKESSEKDEKDVGEDEEKKKGEKENKENEEVKGEKESEEVKSEEEDKEVSEEESSEIKDDGPTYRESEQKLSEDEGKEKKIVYQIMNSSNNIELEDKKDLSEFKKELLRVGEWKHSASSNGILKVTQEMLKTIVKNFKNKVLDNVMVPLGHPSEDDPSKNVGEVTNLGLSKDKNKLIATIDVREKSIVGKIKDRLIKGISASIAENYMEKDTGKHVGPVIFHAALVGEPYVKGMAGFVPLSEEFKDSTVISIMNMEEPLTLNDLSDRVSEIEKKLRLSDESPEEEISEEETSEEKSPEKEIESPKVDSNVKEEEKKSETEENKTEASETEESEADETEEAKDEGVDLADAENLYEKLLKDGRVVPSEKELLIPLLSSKTQIELSETEKVASGKALFDYLMKQPSKIPLSEEGNSGTPEKKEKEEKIPDEISKVLDGMQLSEDQKKEAYKDYKEEKEGEKSSTPF